MADLTAKKVSKLIEEFRQTGKEPEKLVIDIKLMQDSWQMISLQKKLFLR